MAGGIYVALSFPDLDTVDEALEFAGWAPDGDSVAAVAGALLGAVHGYEALPTALCARLELGWVMDTLARDLARQTTENQAGDGWKGDGCGTGSDRSVVGHQVPGGLTRDSTTTALPTDTPYTTGRSC